MTIWDGNQDDRTMSLNDHSEQVFIDSLQYKTSLVQVHLIGGYRIIGKIIGSDDHTILMNIHRPGSIMLYKTAISTISLFEEKNNGK